MKLPRKLDTNGRQVLRLLSYNIQVAIAASKPHHYLTQSWKHVLPHGQIYTNLDQIADLVRHYDLVGLQEVDAGSLRTGFVNQTQYLATQAAFPYWYYHTHRRIGKIARHSNGLLSRISPSEVTGHKLPGLVPGRGALITHFGDPRHPLVVVLLHLALGKRARLQQLEYISDVIQHYEHIVVMGDLNCQPGSHEMEMLLERNNLIEPAAWLNTFPSWNPTRKLDHILVSPSLEVRDVSVLHVAYSDHLPIALEIALPKRLRVAA